MENDLSVPHFCRMNFEPVLGLFAMTLWYLLSVSMHHKMLFFDIPV
jgi:hypothetical protein